MKTCTKCSVSKPVEDFYVNRREKSGRTSWCKECTKKNTKAWWKDNPEKAATSNRNNKLLRKYGITADLYDAMLVAQNFECAICSRIPNPSDRILQVDHDHASGSVRSLLCLNCNLALGLVEDNVETLRAMITYVESHRSIE